MVLIISDRENNIRSDGNPNLVIFDGPCKVKTYKEGPFVILLLGARVEEDGRLSGYDYLFEELLLTLEVIAVIATEKSQKLIEICSRYHVPLIEVG